MGSPSASEYSLDYFEDIFGGRTEEFRELLAILLEMLVQYHASYPSVARDSDPEVLAQFRHKHVTLIENLELVRLRELSSDVGTLEGEAREANIAEVLALVTQLLTSLRAELGAFS